MKNAMTQLLKNDASGLYYYKRQHINHAAFLRELAYVKKRPCIRALALAKDNVRRGRRYICKDGKRRHISPLKPVNGNISCGNGNYNTVAAVQKQAITVVKHACMMAVTEDATDG